MSKSRVSIIRARYIGKNTADFEHFRIYSLFNWIEDGIIVVKGTATPTMGYPDLSHMAKHWQIINGNDKPYATKQK